MWELWKERNRRICSDSEMKSEELVLKIEASIVETINSHLRISRMEEGSFSFWDSQIKKVWPNLINPPLIYFKKSKEARKRCKWTPPLKGWAKLNFDGVARGNPRATGIGCIINNDLGQWITKKIMSISPTSNNLAELRALEEGLKLYHHLGLSKIFIKGDSQIILNAIRNRATPNWVLNSKLENVISLIDRFEDIRICHIYREGN